MSTVRVTLGTGEIHEVEVGPETVVSFKTDVGTGDGRVLTDLKAWCDVASIETADGAKAAESGSSPTDALMLLTRSELNDAAVAHYGIEAPTSFSTKAELVQAIVDHLEANPAESA